MVTKLPFGSSFLYRITDGPCQAEIIPQGAAVRTLIVPDRDGKGVDVALGYDTPEEYLSQGGCLGGVVGRCANRVANATFTLNGQIYPLEANKPPHTCHGGGVGYHHREWTLAPLGDNAVVCTLHSPDGDQGFPGNADITVTYTLANGALTIDYQALSDADTVINLTNHSYFNLDGHATGCVGNHIVRITAEAFTPIDALGIPTGEVRPVSGSVWDLRKPTVLKDRLLHTELEGTQGYDHNFVVAPNLPAAEVYSPLTGIIMTVTTDLPGVQFYTAGPLSQRPGKGGAVYRSRQGLCLESQYPPNAINTPSFPQPVAKKGQLWTSRTTFAFSTLGETKEVM